MKNIVALIGIVCCCVQGSFSVYGQYITGPDEVPAGGTGNFVSHVDEGAEGDIIFWEWSTASCNQCSSQGSSINSATYLFNATGSHDVEYTYTTEFSYGDILWKTVNVLNALAPPVSLTPDPLTVKHNQITARWNSSANATSYLLDVSTSINFSTGTFLPGYSNRSVNSTSEIISGLNPATIYFYRVRAVLASTVSANSSTISIKTATLPPVALAATNLESSSFTANWQQVSGASSYRFDASTSSSFTSFLSGYNDKPVSGTSVSVSNINDQTTIYYRIRAVNSDNILSANSNTILAADFDENYIRIIALTSEGKTTAVQVENANINEKITTVSFFDGLGREIQNVTVKGSPLQNDIVRPRSYDPFGREEKKYLPYAEGSDGWYKPNALKSLGATGTEEQQYRSGRQYTYYQQGALVAQDQYPYAKTVVENSPLNRPLKQGSPGLAWQPDGIENYGSADHTVKMDYVTNSAGEVFLWTYTPPTPTFPLGLVNAGTQATPVFFAANTLQKIKTKDEHNNEVFEYKDKRGKVLLKKVQAPDSEWAETYYIYDDFGNLVTVLPPEAVKAIKKTSSDYLDQTDVNKDNFLKRWAFRYRYDSRNRITHKQVPGAEIIFMVYDLRDRIVLTQDGNQRPGNRWTYTKYDALNRPVMTGIYTHASNADQNTMSGLISTTIFVETFNGSNVNHGYSNIVFPTSNTEPLTITYYDKYSFKSLWTGSYNYVNDALLQAVNAVSYTQPMSENLLVMGQITGSKVKVLDGGVAGGYTWLKTVSYYDDKYRVIQTVSDNYKGGEDRTSILYDFTGKVLMTKSTHVQRDVTWTKKVGVEEVGNKMIKTGSSNAWGNSGASSTQQLPSGQNGYIQVTASEVTTAKMIGLADADLDAGHSNLDYTIYLFYNSFRVFENAVERYVDPVPVAPGETFKIVREGTVIKYYRNTTLAYTSTVPSNTLLIADISLHHYNANPLLSTSIVNVQCSFCESTSTVTRRFEYDHAGRLLRTYHTLDGNAEVLLSQNEYNELGQLVDKALHSVGGSAPKQSVDYRYNIRGWLTSMNNAELTNDAATNDDAGDLFGFNLAYNEVTGTGNSQLYNGNISAMRWSNNLGLGAKKEKAYNYSYDPMNRITGAAFKEKAASWNAATDEGFSESNYTYDLNGNIKTLTRYDKRGNTNPLDNLVYEYGTSTNQSNRLLEVIDSGDDFKGFVDDIGTTQDYTYDANGNMITDQNKGITSAITYNFLNLPETVTKGGNSVRYIYDAGGRKLAQMTNFAVIQKKVDYAGEFQYENDRLQFASHEEGRIVMTSGETKFASDGSSLAAIHYSGATASAITTAGGEKYIQVDYTSMGNSGIYPVASINGLGVTAGETYLLRAKGYRTGTTPVRFLIRVNNLDQGTGATLPQGQSSEAWIEQYITIPSGGTSLKIGLVWPTTATGEQYFVNDIEIVKISTSSPEYQYHLKDHLGNVRLTLTTKPDTDDALATYEPANSTADQAKFLRYENSRKVQSALFDRTNGSTIGYAQRLSGGTNERYGLARSLSVMPGDTIYAEVWAKYVDPANGNRTTALNEFLTQLASLISTGQTSSGTVMDGGSFTSSTTSFPFPTQAGSNTAGSAGTGPKAYLNWLVFDKDFNFLTSKSNFVRISAAPKESGQDVAHELLASPDIIIDEPGYVYIYLSNEESTPIDVYFDDFKVEHHKSPVIATNDYYPFGMTFNSFTRENTLLNSFLFQEKDLVDDLNLQLYNFEWRQYDAAIGRTTTQDPHLGRYWDLSPYSFLTNNPINVIDPLGMDTIPVNKVNPDEKEVVLDVVILEEVVVTPTNEHGVEMLEIEEDGEVYRFTNNTIADIDWQNTIENYLYYVRHPDEFRNEKGEVAPIKDVFMSNRKRQTNILDDMLLDVVDAFAEGNVSDAMEEIKSDRKSKYADRFPSTKRAKKAKEEQRLSDKAKQHGVSVETIKMIEKNPSQSLLESF